MRLCPACTSPVDLSDLVITTDRCLPICSSEFMASRYMANNEVLGVEVGKDSFIDGDNWRGVHQTHVIPAAEVVARDISAAYSFQMPLSNPFACAISRLRITRGLAATSRARSGIQSAIHIFGLNLRGTFVTDVSHALCNKVTRLKTGIIISVSVIQTPQPLQFSDIRRPLNLSGVYL
ncbi:hypothetical protein LZ32DRAFT_664452 [Colletotrichum eremochloae]|nr:hypothetical protein LZ32DRAFT_664452 [Colletotrichum eremochloae]